MRTVIESVKRPPPTPEARRPVYEHTSVIDTFDVSNQLAISAARGDKREGSG